MQPADDKLRKRKKYLGEKKKIDTFRSPTRELILDACHLVDKTRKAAGQLNNHTFPFSSRLHLIFFHRSICSVKFVHENHSKQFVQSVFYHLMIFLLLKTFWWKILENHFKNMHRATLYVNKRAILLVLDRQEKVFKKKIFLNSKKVMHQTERIFS